MNLNLLLLKLSPPKKSNIIVRVICSYPSMDLADFNCNYLNKLESVSTEQKSIFLYGVFNFNLLNYNEHNQTNEFLDSAASNSFITLILQPTRITSHSNTLIDNIFLNVLEPDITAGGSEPLRRGFWGQSPLRKVLVSKEYVDWFNDTGKTLSYSIQYKNLLKYKFGCS